jgi:hypothetical protein
MRHYGATPIGVNGESREDQALPLSIEGRKGF